MLLNTFFVELDLIRGLIRLQMYPMRFLKFFLVVFLLSNFQEVLKGFHILKSKNIIKSCKFSLKLNLKNFEILLLIWILKPHTFWMKCPTYMTFPSKSVPTICYGNNLFNIWLQLTHNGRSKLYKHFNKIKFFAILSYHYRFSKINWTLIFI